MVDVRVPLVLAAVGLAVNAILVYRELPLSESVPDVMVGVAAVTLALLTWRASRALSGQALLGAITWWAGTAWPVAPHIPMLTLVAPPGLSRGARRAGNRPPPA